MKTSLASLPPHPTARDLLEERQRSGDPPKLSTGSKPLDSLLEGGLLPGETTELCGPRSSGRFSLVLAALSEATRTRQTAFVDLGSGLEGETAKRAGVDFDHLFWVRPRNLQETLIAAETLTKTGIPLLVVDLGIPPIPGGRGAPSVWQRLSRTARSHQVALLVSSPYRTCGHAPDRVVELVESRTSWQGREPASRILLGISSRLRLEKSRARPWHTSSAVLRLPVAGEIGSRPRTDEASPFPAPQIDRDREVA